MAQATAPLFNSTISDRAIHHLWPVNVRYAPNSDLSRCSFATHSAPKRDCCGHANSTCESRSQSHHCNGQGNRQR